MKITNFDTWLGSFCIPSNIDKGQLGLTSFDAIEEMEKDQLKSNNNSKPKYSNLNVDMRKGTNACILSTKVLMQIF